MPAPEFTTWSASYSAAAFSDAIAALTRGITSSAISCSERFVGTVRPNWLEAGEAVP